MISSVGVGCSLYNGEGLSLSFTVGESRPVHGGSLCGSPLINLHVAHGMTLDLGYKGCQGRPTINGQFHRTGNYVQGTPWGSSLGLGLGL